MEQKPAPENINTNQPAPEAPAGAPGKKNGRTPRLIAGILVILLVAAAAVMLLIGSRYEKAAKLYDAGRYAEAQAAFEALGTYKDSAARASECRSAAAYQAAEDLFGEGRFAEAQAAFEALGTYKDSAARAEECAQSILAASYAEAEALYTAGRFAEAQAAFEALGTYGDSAARAEECAEDIRAASYAEAEALYTAGRFAEAQAAFEALGSYRDSAQRALRCGQETEFAAAVALYDSGEYEKAAGAFAALGSFKDAPEYVLRSKYAYVLAHEDRADLLTRSYLSELTQAGYEDSAQILSRLVNDAAMTETAGTGDGGSIVLSFCLLPGETAVIPLPAAEDILRTNAGDAWLELSEELPKKSFAPNAPLTEAEYTASPRIDITDAKGNTRTLTPGSFTLVFPAAELQITEPAVIPEEGVMCAEGNKLHIAGIAGGQGVTVAVNGSAVAADDAGRFDTDWVLSGPEKETVVITVSGNDLVTVSASITALPCKAPAQPAEPQITFVPEGSDMFADPLKGTVLGTQTVYVYAGPGQEYAQLAPVAPGEQLDAMGAAADWFLVEYKENSYGWLNGASYFGEWMFSAGKNPYLTGLAPAAEYLQPPQKLTVTAEEGAEMFADPAAPEFPLCCLAAGTECVCFGTAGDWRLCCSGTAFGWIDRSCCA